jgi:hypothetical protein
VALSQLRTLTREQQEFSVAQCGADFAARLAQVAKGDPARLFTGEAGCSPGPDERFRLRLVQREILTQGSGLLEQHLLLSDGLPCQ